MWFPGLVNFATDFWLGRLPGDIVIERDDFRLYFPITTCVLLSLIVTLALWLLRVGSRAG